MEYLRFRNNFKNFIPADLAENMVGHPNKIKSWIDTVKFQWGTESGTGYYILLFHVVIINCGVEDPDYWRSY